MKRKALAVLTLLLVTLFLQVPAAYASSVFDETYKTTSTLYVGDANCDFRANITNTWSSYITDEALWGGENASMTQDAKEAFLEAQEDGDVSVSQVSWQQTSTRIGKYVTVYFSEDKTSYLEWSGWNQAVSVKGYQYGLLIGCTGIDASHPTIWLFSTPVNNTAGMLSQASSASSSPITTNFFTTAAQNLPSGYDGVSIATQPVRPKYVAMGDSFSSGEGNTPFEAETDQDDVNECHRSSQAYPRLLQGDSSLSLGSMDFVACSGATTDNVLNGQWDESAQVNALSEDTEVVTITIGGNNVGFREFAVACAVTVCDFSTTAYSDIHGKILNDLPGELADVYDAIDGATSSTADIYVVGYPHIAPAEMPSGASSFCTPLNGGNNNPDPELNNGATVRAVIHQLNAVIEDAVEDTGSSKFHFVDPNLTGSPFIGHDWCEQDRYFQIVTFNNVNHSFHPNTDGHEAYKTVVGGEIS